MSRFYSVEKKNLLHSGEVHKFLKDSMLFRCSTSAHAKMRKSDKTVKIKTDNTSSTKRFLRKYKLGFLKKPASFHAQSIPGSGTKSISQKFMADLSRRNYINNNYAITPNYFKIILLIN